MNEPTQLPEQITLKRLMYADGHNGSATQVAGNKELGIVHVAHRHMRGADFKTSWVCNALFRESFDTYQELRDRFHECELVAEPLSDEGFNAFELMLFIGWCD